MRSTEIVHKNVGQGDTLPSKYRLQHAIPVDYPLSSSLGTFIHSHSRAQDERVEESLEQEI